MNSEKSWFLMWLVMFLLVLLSFIESHELAHAAICEEFGGTAKRNGFELKGGLLETSTMCTLPAEITKDDLLAYNIADSSGEWTYPLQALIAAIFMHALLVRRDD